MASGLLCYFIFTFIFGCTVFAQDGGYICPPGCECTTTDQSTDIECDSYQGNTIPPINANVTKFILYGGNVTKIGKNDFENATALHTLIIGRTPLNTIEAGAFDNMGALDLVSIHDNSLMGLPDNLFKNNMNMHRLFLFNNLLVAVTTKTFIGLDNLRETLDLNNNDISTLPDGAFDMFTKLERLTMKFNGVTSISTNLFQKMSLLSSLDLQNNQISKIFPGAFNLTSRLANLNLANNNLPDLPTDLFRGNGYLSNLDLSNNNFTSVPTGALRSAVNLNILKLDSNHINTLNKGDFQPIPNLKNLSIGFTDELMTVKPQAFDGLQNLLRLNMTNNPNLESMDPNVFTDSSSLTDLLLSNNNIAAFKQELFTGPAALRKADIHGNPLFCDCGAQWIRQAMDDQETYPWIQDWNDLTCNGPKSMSQMKLSTIPEQEYTCSRPKIISTEEDELAGNGILLSALMYGGIPWSIWTLPDGTQVSPSGGPVNSSKTVYASGDTVTATETRFANFSVLAVLQIELVVQAGKYILEAHNAADDITTKTFLVSKPKPTAPGISGAMIGAIIASIIAVVLAVLLGVFLWRKMKAARYSRMDEPRGVISPSSQSEVPTFDKIGETSGIAKGQRSYGGVAAGSTGNSEVV